jgi:DNA polymerase-1
VTVAQNLPFDIEHLVELLDDESILTGKYGDYMQASFALDPGPPESARVNDGGQEGPGHLSLDFMCSREFGLSLKAMSPTADALIKKGRAEEIGLSTMLPYNGLDAKWTLLGWREQMVKIRIQHMERAYQMQMDRVGPVVMAQRQGMLVDSRINKAFDAQLTASLEAVREELLALPEVQEYERRFGTFDPNKPAQVGKLLADVCGFEEVRGAQKGKWKTDKVLLAEVGKSTPVIAPIIRFREDAKLKSTYIDRFQLGHEKSLVYQDGKVHYEMGIAKARTGRLQSEKPNGQNWPKRKFKEIRGQLVPRPGHWFLSADQGQVEARMLACESRDPVWVKALWADTDVHAVWAEKAAELYDPWFQKHARGDDGKKLPLKKAMKECRGTAKNGFVFPWFYGASDRAVGEAMDWPEDVTGELSSEFWSPQWFAGIKQWQRKKWKQYQRDHMVRSLTGRRRLAPLSWNQVINTPIQADASDVTVDAWVRLWRQSVRENKPWLAALLQVHDDLIFEVPDEYLDDAIEDVVMGQLGYRADWLNIPLSVEVEVGRDWASMTPVGVFRSDQI